jgi:mannose/fructose-specific phosphotransferase system component IIA
MTDALASGSLAHTEVLLLTHASVASALAGLASHVFGPEVHRRIGICELDVDAPPQAELGVALAWSGEHRDSWVLVLTDLHGSTPWRVGQDLVTQLGPSRARALSGVNAPMLLAVIERWDTLPLDGLVRRARVAGRRGIA